MTMILHSFTLERYNVYLDDVGGGGRRALLGEDSRSAIVIDTAGLGAFR